MHRKQWKKSRRTLFWNGFYLYLFSKLIVFTAQARRCHVCLYLYRRLLPRQRQVSGGTFPECHTSCMFDVCVYSMNRMISTMLCFSIDVADSRQTIGSNSTVLARNFIYFCAERVSILYNCLSVCILLVRFYRGFSLILQNIWRMNDVIRIRIRVLNFQNSDAPQHWPPLVNRRLIAAAIREKYCRSKGREFQSLLCRQVDKWMHVRSEFREFIWEPSFVEPTHECGQFFARQR